jgi:hypothetical protein
MHISQVSGTLQAIACEQEVATVIYAPHIWFYNFWSGISIRARKLHFMRYLLDVLHEMMSISRCQHISYTMVPLLFVIERSLYYMRHAGLYSPL